METTAARIPERWVNPIRIATVLIVLLHLALFTMGIPPRYVELTRSCASEVCLPLQPKEADIAALEELGLSLNFYGAYLIALDVVLVVICLLLIGLLFWRASALWIGIIAILGTTAIATIIPLEISALGRADPKLYPLYVLAATTSTAGLFLTYYLFPDGRFYPRWMTIPVAILIPVVTLAQSTIGSEFIDYHATSDALSFVTDSIAPVVVLITGLITQAIRYRSYYDSFQRQQTRWLIAANVGTVAGVITFVALFEFRLVPAGSIWILTTFVAATILVLGSVSLLPYALTISILRYRLWNIDVIIRRTVTYSAIMTLLAALYFGTVTALQALFTQLIGSNSPLAVVISTLAIAALFTPLRRRVQTFVDRRFYRQKYNAERTLERFSETVRDEVDLDTLTGKLTDLVQETMQPEHLQVWLADPRRNAH